MSEAGALVQLSSDIVKETLAGPTVFKDESPLSLEYMPRRLLHRDAQMRFLTQLFRFSVENPFSTSQRVLITGDVGTGKTVLSQRFGADLVKAAKNRKINLQYAHVNCREAKGSLFMIIKRVLTQFEPEFPKRGFAPEELLHTLMDVLDDKNMHLILALDELENLIRTEGTNPIYNLTRIQEERVGKPIRLSLICILREQEYLQKLDKSTIDTLQRNIVKLDKYSSLQLIEILRDRAESAFKENIVSDEALQLVSDIGGQSGDARYSIELLWRAGKYADSENAKHVSTEHVRKAAGSVYPTLRGEYINALSSHEKYMLLALARVLGESQEAYASIGAVEREYKAVCEEYNDEPRKHTQIWKYARGLGAIGIIAASKSGEGVRGKTTLLGLQSIPASTMREQLEAALTSERKRKL
ncbi:MAG TPA: ORC1-type DNA replication protein [Candidatus Saccharimonadales bacterium]|nr:ORC1-type DNA replication protein [Candidatus Saccharimonadales bacterium]